MVKSFCYYLIYYPINFLSLGNVRLLWKLADMLSIENFVEKSTSAVDLDSLYELYSSAMSEFGFSRLLFSLLNDHCNIEIGEAQPVVYSNYPREWLSHYVACGYNDIDPVREEVFSQFEPFLWSSLYTPELTTKQKRMFDEAGDAKLFNGIGVPLRGPNGAVAGVGAASTERSIELSPSQLDYINLISNQFYFCFLRLSNKSYASIPFTLTQREKEVLKWSAVGMSRSEVSVKLCLSRHTIDFHLRNTFEKLGASGITAAVAKAVTLRLIVL